MSCRSPSKTRPARRMINRLGAVPQQISRGAASRAEPSPGCHISVPAPALTPTPACGDPIDGGEESCHHMPHVHAPHHIARIIIILLLPCRSPGCSPVLAVSCVHCAATGEQATNKVNPSVCHIRLSRCCLICHSSIHACIQYSIATWLAGFSALQVCTTAVVML